MRAHVGLADSYALISSYYLAPQDELIPKARAAALKALQFDDGLVGAETADIVLLQTSLRRYLHLLPSVLQRQFMEEQLAELGHPPAATA